MEGYFHSLFLEGPNVFLCVVGGGEERFFLTTYVFLNLFPFLLIMIAILWTLILHSTYS